MLAQAGSYFGRSASAAGSWAAAGWLLAAVAVLNLAVARQLGRVPVAR